jgi:hypothetical protein
VKRSAEVTATSPTRSSHTILSSRVSCLRLVERPEPLSESVTLVGCGIVESGNKVVMQARLKGAGMHWATSHVNPMLALRTAACNNRWDEAQQQIRTSRREQGRLLQ